MSLDSLELVCHFVFEAMGRIVSIIDVQYALAVADCVASGPELSVLLSDYLFLRPRYHCLWDLFHPPNQALCCQHHFLLLSVIYLTELSSFLLSISFSSAVCFEAAISSFSRLVFGAFVSLPGA